MILEILCFISRTKEFMKVLISKGMTDEGLMKLINKTDAFYLAIENKHIVTSDREFQTRKRVEVRSLLELGGWNIMVN